ncbi:alginate lyase family protein [Cellulophaga sp. E16_2]|uniref:Heparinase II/III family protein n=1 Tax=Cellulophaga algicola (strain DSM 14237 / IC166 / ACAM 630) TaxID=688270 RepID=E6X480_CELAD|nr:MULTISPECIES: alginate lyase family protein [Cellulophaga]ADV51463.1 Heparinase II/III family protein [Cellulophaga algicola DSM 14237]MBO0593836.1 alginate lyase family protein [Cellulophaga sp. E16_2]
MKFIQSITLKLVPAVLLISLFSCKEEVTVVSKEEDKTASEQGAHPNLILTAQGVKDIRAQLGNIPIFDATLKAVQEEVDAEIFLGIDTPIPEDYSGGYTHVRHKSNMIILQKAGVLYQILDDEKYAKYVKDMLMQYEAMYKTLPLHPKTRSYARGKLFWQCLNDANWLVYVSQAYDCVYNYLSEEERNKLETNLFKPFADHISVDSPQFYQRVHNHSTWGNAAVGMIGLVMNDQELIDRALYGIKDLKLDTKEKDDDGGFLNKDGKAGFLANIEEPFSPDGYYNEGPYYQRYAMYPFLIFAEGLHNVKPELKIFEYKEGVLLKSINALLNLSDADGDFFPLNDGQKGMSYYNDALVTATDISYYFGTQDPGLLSIAEKQNKVLLDDSGLAVALGIKNGLAKPFDKKSINLSDGPEGTQGGVGILRNEDIELVFKYAAQGSSHGHYDKLSYSLYENGEEVIQDYGLARFVNIEQKGGGNYLKENKTWAKQTIAHNTVTQNEMSHFNGKYEIGSQNHSVLHYFSSENDNVQAASAKEVNAYPGTEMLRTMAIIKDPDFEKPYVLDIMKVVSNKANQYDFPYYFLGQVLNTNFEYKVPETLKALGSKNGYQHLYVEGTAKSETENTKFSWLNKGKFYTLTTITGNTDELLFTRIGANDPEFNLRREAALMLRRKNTQNTLFVSAIEAHGSYSPVTESAVNSNSAITALKVVLDTEDYTAIAITNVNGTTKLFITANTNAGKEAKHNLKINNKDYEWSGPYCFK